MSIFKAIERALEAAITFFWRLFILIHELKNIWAKRSLVRSFEPTAEQAREAKEYWKGVLGHPLPLWWHRLYASYTGRFDPRYIPEILFAVRLEPNAFNYADARALDDKAYLQLFAGDGMRVPIEYAFCRAGVISVGGGVLPMSRFCDEFGNIGPCVIKRTRDTSSGRDVFVADLVGGVDRNSGLSVEDIAGRLGDDWVCQERVVQHESIAAIYPDAVNTMRIVTYMTNEGVGVCPVALRIGRNGARVDNAHAGGMFVHVRADGALGSEAYTEFQERFREHPGTGISFGDCRIVGVDLAIEACRRQHLALGELGFISWDVCIDEAGQPVFIEVNLVSQAVWFPQMASGEAMFGDDTASVVRRYRNRRRA